MKLNVITHIPRLPNWIEPRNSPGGCRWTGADVQYESHHETQLLICRTRNNNYIRRRKL